MSSLQGSYLQIVIYPGIYRIRTGVVLRPRLVAEWDVLEMYDVTDEHSTSTELVVRMHDQSGLVEILAWLHEQGIPIRQVEYLERA